jgi:uncharacterized protein (DUF4415 family)
LAKGQCDLPEGKTHLTMRLDNYVIAYFKRGGRGYQSRINAVLRAYVNAQLLEEARREGRQQVQAEKPKRR